MAGVERARGPTTWVDLVRVGGPGSCRSAPWGVFPADSGQSRAVSKHNVLVSVGRGGAALSRGVGERGAFLFCWVFWAAVRSFPIHLSSRTACGTVLVTAGFVFRSSFSLFPCSSTVDSMRCAVSRSTLFASLSLFSFFLLTFWGGESRVPCHVRGRERAGVASSTNGCGDRW